MAETLSSTPQLKGFDHTLAFLREGYMFISNRCDQLSSDRFRTRIMLKQVVCLRGEPAAEMFYGRDLFTRQSGAMPPTVLRLLQDTGSVQLLDGAAHRHRKALFISLLMTDAAEASFLDRFRAEWLAAVDDWAGRPNIVLFDEVNLVLTRAICQWAGVALERKSDKQMCRELTAMIEHSGSVAPSVVLALAHRRRCERYIVDLVKRIRSERIDASSSPLARIAQFHDPDGELLDPEAAAVEVLNILRPTVAIGRFIMFAAMALHGHPKWHGKLMGAENGLYERFAEEVRRIYPFFPVIGGIARRAFEWQGHEFSCGDWVLLDLHGTNHDPRRFPGPHSFDPDRALSWQDQGFDFIPQGGGKAPVNHRCPGERLTVATVREACRLMVEAMTYEVPPQDLSMPLNRMPARPKSGMVLAKVRRA